MNCNAISGTMAVVPNLELEDNKSYDKLASTGRYFIILNCLNQCEYFGNRYLYFFDDEKKREDGYKEGNEKKTNEKVLIQRIPNQLADY